jgi:PAT family beta-lactamase induction signal transducer AmpG
MSEAEAAHEAAHDASTRRRAWRWIPTLYFAEGVPYVVVMTVAVIALKRLGIDNSRIALYTSWLYLPYAVKPLWSPLVQRLGTRRRWILLTQLSVAAALAATALAVPADDFLRWMLVGLAVAAVSSATHDVAADGFYMLALSSHEQAWFVGIRSTFYRLAMIAGQGLLVMAAGWLESSTGLTPVAIEVQAGDAAPADLAFDPQQFAPASDKVEAQALLVGDASPKLSLAGRSASEVAALAAKVRQWNLDHGFVEPPRSDSPTSPQAARAGWVTSLEHWIRSRFGETETVRESAERDGDATVVLGRLAAPLASGGQQVVQFVRSGGSADIRIVEGERFVVTSENADAPFAALVQVDGKLDAAATARFEFRAGDVRLAWATTFGLVAASFVLLALYHGWALPRPAGDRAGAAAAASAAAGFVAPFVAFFRKPRIAALLAFLLLYRFGEAQLVKLAAPFLLDAREAGGLGLSTSEVGFVYGTVGVVMLTAGGILGGFVAARDGLKHWLWKMALAIHLPNAAFWLLAYFQPENFWLVCAGVGAEQFGYGFGFTAYMLYSIYIARGEHETVHYALCTGAMALGMMIPGMWSGWLQELVGYKHFFVWIMLCTLPSFAAVALIPLDADFGRKSARDA